MAKWKEIEGHQLAENRAFWHIQTLLKRSNSEAVGRAFKAIYAEIPGSVDGTPLSPEELALYVALLLWLEQIPLWRTLDRMEQ